MGNKEAVIAFTQDLSQYCRYTTRTETAMTDMREELRLIRNYLEIHKLREMSRTVTCCYQATRNSSTRRRQWSYNLEVYYEAGCRGRIDRDAPRARRGVSRGKHNRAAAPEQGSPDSDRAPSLSGKVRQFVEGSLERDLSLQLLSDALGFHPAYLSKAFKAETGETLSDYLLKRRMEHAVVLLKKTGYKIYEVSEKAGYQTTHHFIKQFKRFYGITPQQYRNRQIGRN
ncbi:helix-turn-helix domain-containing protein [Paenibacillus arenilitoris]|uniref:Helix-turn-helix domain-containing protein n=1 Tax=Paenibacillus arenilitoris TaxID=2772299 RepID=A0A927H6F3_9BACL|nr:helix-turn-helix domain-containing protein [Paenibacillus arenilitoris]MBD2869447.1 helix-turn-helix domain-containing protein [Paenibacillus arenilitoris]